MSYHASPLLVGMLQILFTVVFSGVINWLDNSAKADHPSPDTVCIDVFESIF